MYIPDLAHQAWNPFEKLQLAATFVNAVWGRTGRAEQPAVAVRSRRALFPPPPAVLPHGALFAFPLKPLCEWGVTPQLQQFKPGRRAWMGVSRPLPHTHRPEKAIMRPSPPLHSHTLAPLCCEITPVGIGTGVVGQSNICVMPGLRCGQGERRGTANACFRPLSALSVTETEGMVVKVADFGCHRSLCAGKQEGCQGWG